MTNRKGLAAYNDGKNINVILYNTKILSIEILTNNITLNTGGYSTNHTKNCINDWLPEEYSVFQKNFEWYVSTPQGVVDFKDNMVLNINEGPKELV